MGVGWGVRVLGFVVEIPATMMLLGRAPPPEPPPLADLPLPPPPVTPERAKLAWREDWREDWSDDGGLAMTVLPAISNARKRKTAGPLMVPTSM